MVDARFETTFGYAPAVDNFTPGRVNLIGEHTDYNGGMVLPTALPLGVSIALSPRGDARIRITSDKFEDIAERSLRDNAAGHWSDYIVGAVIAAQAAGLIAGGADVAVQTTLPFGAGISSSAAVTVGILKLAREVAGSVLSDTEIAVMARHVENDFIGVPCGIMDQMAVAIARPGQALSLDTRTLAYDLVDLPDNYHMAVMHSGVYRQLNEGRYKERKEECDAVKAAMKTAGMAHDDICLLSDAEFDALDGLSDTLTRRARHCMTEHRRTVLATQMLSVRDMNGFGRLMNESHISMRDDFDISVPPVDALVADAVRFGALGARQTGGGFGGCIVACVSKDRLSAWRDAVLSTHSKAFWVT